MRLATLILSLILSLAVFFQSCAAAVGGSLGQNFADTASERAESEDLSGAAAVGFFGGILWIVGAAFVIGKPKVAVWTYGVAIPLFVVAGAGGWGDAFIWAVVSAGFALMSWRGTKEKAAKDEREHVRYQADVALAASAIATPTANAAPVPGSVAPPRAS